MKLKSRVMTIKAKGDGKWRPGMMGKGSRSGSDSCPVPQLTTCPNYLAGTLVSPAVFWPGRYLVLACTKVINGIALSEAMWILGRCSEMISSWDWTDHEIHCQAQRWSGKEQPASQKRTAGAPGDGPKCPQPAEGATGDDRRYALYAACRIRVSAPHCPWRLGCAGGWC